MHKCLIYYIIILLTRIPFCNRRLILLQKLIRDLLFSNCKMTEQKSPVNKPSIHVIFRKIEESYLVNTDITVHYSISGDLEVNSNDWIGLYRVGWRSHSDYVYYEWAPNSNDTERSSDNENKVVFPG